MSPTNVALGPRVVRFYVLSPTRRGGEETGEGGVSARARR